IDYERAHRARAGLLLSIHKVIGDHGPIRRGKQLAQADRPDRRIARVETRRTLLKCVVLNGCALRKPAAKLSNALPLAHQLDFRQAELLSFGEVFVGLIREIRLSKCAIDHLVHHSHLSLRDFQMESKRPKNERYRCSATLKSSVDTLSPLSQSPSSFERSWANTSASRLITAATRLSASWTALRGSSTKPIWMLSHLERNSFASFSTNSAAAPSPSFFMDVPAGPFLA